MPRNSARSEAGVTRAANQHRRIQFSPADLDEALAKRLALSHLARYQSFQRFLDRLKTALSELNIITEDCGVDLR